MYLVGTIGTTHGIKGELVVINKSDFNRFYIDAELYCIVNNEELKLIITSLREHKNNYLVTFNNYNNINDVLFLKGHDLYSKVKATISKDEYYYEDLIDKKVYLTDGTLVGVVSSIIDTTYQKLLEIELVNKVKRLVPFVDEFVKEVTKTKVIISVIDGLL